MKKSFIKFFICFIVFPLLLSSCAEKKENNNNVTFETRYKIYNFIGDFTFSALSNKNIFYMPYFWKNELNRTVIKNGIFSNVFELYFSGRVNSGGDLSFYDIYCDDGSWVDDLLISIEEERLGEELEKMEHMRNANMYVADEAIVAFNVEKKINELVSREAVNTNGTLEFMEFGEEIFIPEKKGNEWILTSVFKEKVTRRFYDELFRCYSEEIWNIDNNGTEELKKISETNFYDKTFKPSLKKIIKSDSIKKQFYNEKGFIEKEEEFSIIDGDEYIQKSVNIKYNDIGQVIENSETDYTYDKSDCKKKLYSFNKKYLYTYPNSSMDDNGDDIPPNFDYYEDGILRIKNEYFSFDNYTSQIFFDSNFSVTTFYENGMLVKEIFNTGNGTERIKYYE